MKAKSDNRMTVNLPVTPILKEYIIATNGSDVITPGKRDWLWLLIKQHLVVDSPDDQRPEPDCVIKIALLDCHNSKTAVYQPSQKRSKDEKEQAALRQQHVIHLNTLFRYRLSLTGEKVIRDFLYRQFKETFLTFIAAQRIENPKKGPLAIIRQFFDMYEIDDRAITEDMIKKSWTRDWRYQWLRSRQRRLVEKGETYCGSVF